MVDYIKINKQDLNLFILKKEHEFYFFQKFMNKINKAILLWYNNIYKLDYINIINMIEVKSIDNAGSGGTACRAPTAGRHVEEFTIQLSVAENTFVQTEVIHYPLKKQRFLRFVPSRSRNNSAPQLYDCKSSGIFGPPQSDAGHIDWFKTEIESRGIRQERIIILPEIPELRVCDF